MVYGKFRRRRLRRKRLRLRRRFRPRYKRFLRRMKYKYKRFRRKTKSNFKKLMDTLLPTIPIKYIKTTSGTGTYAARSWLTMDTIGNLVTINNYKDYLPNSSLITDDGSGGTSTHLSFQGYYNKRFKVKHTARYTCQNVANTTMFATIHICAYRRDYSEKENPSITGDFMSADLINSAMNGALGVNINSSLPASSYIANFYQYPQATIFDSPTTCSQLKVLKTYKLRVPPGGWFKFKVRTGWKNLDKAWLIENAGQIKHLKGWSKVPVVTWHGELCQKAGDISSTTLSVTDFICYQTHCITLKALAFHRKSTVFQVPVNISTGTPLAFAPVIRPQGVIQVTETNTVAEDKG